jgi:hypothetical protein
VAEPNLTSVLASDRDLSGRRLGAAARQLFLELRWRENVGTVPPIEMPAEYPWAVELYSRPRGRWAVAVRTMIRGAGPDGWRWESSGRCPTVNHRTVLELVHAGYAEWLEGAARLAPHVSRWRDGSGDVLRLTDTGRREVADARA